MPNLTAKLGLNLFLENEVVDFEQINANFRKLDSLRTCTESGTKTSNYPGGSDGVATWRYKKYSDNTISLTTRLNFTNLKCTEGSAPPYYSATSEVVFPFAFSAIHNVQMHLASPTIGWVADSTGASTIDRVTFRLVGLEKETTIKYKQVYISVEGVLV